MKAVVIQEGKTTGIETKEIPQIEKDEVLVKVVGVSLNPTDWKHVEYISPAGNIVGCDYSGVVEKVGESVTHLKIGDRIGGIVHGSSSSKFGSFSEYTSAVADLAYKKPDHLSHEENATFGVGSLTAAACLYQKLGLPTPSKPSTDPLFLLVWSGATSVGQFAVQLGKLSGLKVITTCSPKNFSLLSSLGADHVFDYRDPDVVKKIKEATQNKLAYALDCVSEPESLKNTIESLGEKGGKVATLLFTKIENPRKDVEIVHELLYTAIGREFSFGPTRFAAVPEDRSFIANYIKTELNHLLEAKKIKPNVTKTLEGGLAGIPEGLNYLKAGKASAEKLVAHVQNE